MVGLFDLVIFCICDLSHQGKIVRKEQVLQKIQTRHQQERQADLKNENPKTKDRGRQADYIFKLKSTSKEKFKESD